METPKTRDIPKPWENTLHVGVSREVVDGKEVDAVVWYCSCGEYTTAWKVGVEALKLAQHAGEHMDQHPKPPISIVQLGDKSFVMVFAVPGASEENPAHMTVAVSEDVFMDNKKLAEHIGPIGSTMHFSYQKTWKDHEAGEHSLAMMPISVMRIDPQGNISPMNFASGLQQVMDILHARQAQEQEQDTQNDPTGGDPQRWTGFLNSPPVLRFDKSPMDYTQPGVVPPHTEGLHPQGRWTPEMVGEILKASGYEAVDIQAAVDNPPEEGRGEGAQT